MRGTTWMGPLKKIDPTKIDGFGASSFTFKAPDFSKLTVVKTVDVSGPSQSLTFGSAGAANEAIGAAIFASASGSGHSSVSISLSSYSDSSGSYTSGSVSTMGDSTHISATLFSDHNLI